MVESKNKDKSLAMMLRRQNYGESDMIVSLLTEDHGQLDCFARSARRSRKRFGAGLDYFVLGMATIKASNKKNTLANLTNFDVVEDWSTQITTTMHRVQLATYVNLLVRLSTGQANDPAVFSFMTGALRSISKASVGDFERLLSKIELGVANAAGILDLSAPELHASPDYRDSVFEIATPYSQRDSSNEICEAQMLKSVYQQAFVSLRLHFGDRLPSRPVFS